MNIQRVIILFFTLLQFLYIPFSGAQEHHHEDEDCNGNEQENIARSMRQQMSDSMDLVRFVPAVPVTTAACRPPSGMPGNVTFTIRKDKIYGFFPAVPNADLYLVVIARAGSPVYKPENGIRYNTGDYLGKGRVVAANGATTFIASELEPDTRYRIDIYAGNTNCSGGVIYRQEPVYSAEKGTAATTVYNYYYGNLHSHSSYSDGNKDNTSLVPADDYAFAKDAECMDFLGIAEHNHFSFPGNPGMHLADYHLGLEQASTFTSNNPGFLALYGMEYGVISNGGHLVIYGIDSLLGWETISGAPNYDIFVGKYDYNGLFNVINRFKPTDAFGFFAHPDDNDYSNLLHTAYRPMADSAIVGAALENGPAFSDAVNYTDYPSSMSYLQYYKGILAKGYHIGPTIDHDNHNLTFGRTARSRLVVLSPSLDKADFMQAMRSRHFYATHSCTAVLDFLVSGAEMGTEAELAHEPAIAVSITDASSGQQPNIRIYKGTNDGNPAVIAATGNGNTFTYTDNTLADGSSAYYFADIRIGSARTISAPVWYRRNDQAGTKITDVPAGTAGSRIRIRILGNPVTNGQLVYQIEGLHKTLKGDIVIADVFGRIVYKKAVIVDEQRKTITLQGFPAGTYMIRFVSDEGKAYAKFVTY